MKIPYPIVSKKNPFFYVTVDGFDFSAVTATGDTRIQVYRVWRNTSDKDPPPTNGAFNMPPDYVSPYNIPPYYVAPADGSSDTAWDLMIYTPIEQKRNRFSFIFDDAFLAQDGGRYRADFYYKGTYVTHVYFVYNKQNVKATGSVYV